MHKINKTTRKFYNKWLYKITVRAPGAAVFRMADLNQIPTLLNHSSQTARSMRLHYLSKACAHQEDINLIASSLSLLDKKSYFTRVERDCLDIYVNDREIFDDLCDDFKGLIKQISIPDPDNLTLLDRKVIIVKKYPKEEFHYRVYLKPHTIKDREDKFKYLEWLSQNSDYSISNSVKSWFLTTDYNWDRRYMLVKNESALLMMKLRNSDVVGAVYEYVISDK